jgi:TonB family protein
VPECAFRPSCFHLIVSDIYALKKITLRNSVFRIFAGLLMLKGGNAFSQTPSTAPLLDRTDAVPEMQFEADQQSWARVTRVVPPKYPKEALEKSIGATVDIEVLIGEDGYVKEVRSLESSPKNVQFEDATRDVLKYWTFGVMLSARCEPIETVGTARLDFAVNDGKENVSLSHRKLPERPPVTKSPRLVSVNWDEVKRNVVYPSSARRAGASANVWVVATIDPSLGKVTAVEISAVRSNPRIYESAFLEAARGAVKDLEYQPILDYAKPIKMCIPFTFRLRN